MVNTWNSDCITPLEETDSTKVLDAQQQLQKTLSAGSNILIENGQISASGTLSNVQADWTQNDSAEPDYIKNKPQNLVQDATYVHTDNNFSDSDKEKLNGIAAGAEVNVQSDWNVSDSDSDAFIKNKPTIPIVDQIYNGNSTNAQAGVAVSSAISTAVGGIRQVPSTQSTDNGKVLGVTDDQGTVGWVQPTAEQVQSDWNEADSSAPDFIKNKPTIPSFDQTQMAAINSGVNSTKVGNYDTHIADTTIHVTTSDKSTWNAKQDAIADLNTIRSGAAAGATAIQPGSLAVVATSGDYNDLLNKPTIPAAQVQSDWNESDPSSKAFILNKPVIPAVVVVDQTYDASSANAQSGTAVASAISTKQDIISDLATIRSGAADGATAVQPGNLATVATTGAYSDLSGTPTIPVVDQSYSSSSVNAQSGVAVAGAIANKQDTIADLATIRANALLGSTAVQPGDLATVATTGAYSDLSGTPTIPSGDELVPSASSSDAGKVLTVDNNGDPSWVTPSAGTVYTAGDGVDITNNVISADVDGTTIGIDSTTKKIKLLSTIPTVDQTYSASSQNAQSGVAVASAISTKQDVINDLATIRTGAGLGATAVQPGDLATVATTGSYNDLSDKPTIPAAVTVDQTYNASSTNAQSGTAVAGAISTKQDTISDLATIRSGAAAGATAVQPSSLATVATSGSYTDLSDKPSIPAAQVNSDWNSSSGVTQILNKPTLATVATTGDYEDLLNKPSIPAAVTVDQTYSASSTNPQSGTAVAGALATVNQVPASTSSDSTKVLTVNSSGAPVWAAAQGGTVDQVYNASSTNAQSGTAVAGALAAVPTKPLVAGSNITITENTNDITLAASIPSVDEVPAVTSSDDGKVLKATYSGGQGSYAWAAAQGGTTYSAGDGITISNDTIAADVDGTTIGIDSTTKKIKLLSAIPTVPTAGNMLSVNNGTLNVTTTAGITDIQQVASLPANPVSTVLYLIPET